MKLSHVVLVPTFFANIVVLLKATDNDIHFDLGRNILYQSATSETVCYIKQLGGYQALMHREPTNSLDLITKLTFSTFKRYQPITAPNRTTILLPDLPISAPDLPIPALVTTTATSLNTTSTTLPELLNILQPAVRIKTYRRYKQQFKLGNKLQKHLRESYRYTQQQQET